MATHTRGPGDLSVAKLSLYGTIAGAIITAVTTVTVAVVNHNNGPTAPTEPASPTLSNSELRFGPITNGKLTVSGSAQKDFNGMYVMIGPKSSGGYDSGCGNVVNQQWHAEVATDPSWQKYPLVTVPSHGFCPDATTGTTTGTAFKFTFQSRADMQHLADDPTNPLPETTSPSPPPPDVMACVEKLGPSCLTGPGFGPPSVYQPKQ
jgi:hypothetical protein